MINTLFIISSFSFGFGFYNTIKVKLKQFSLHERAIKQIYKAHKNASCWRQESERTEAAEHRGG